MQLTIDLSTTDEAGARKAIRAIEAYCGLPSLTLSDRNVDHGKAVAWDSVCEQLTETCPGWEGLGASGIDAACAAIRQLKRPAATVLSVPTPLPFPLPVAPSTVAADPQQSAPEVTPASSPEPSVPPVPAVPTVPTVAAPTAPVTPSSPVGVEVDKDGLPWDARIHSGSKALNADGTWRKRRNLPDGEMERVEAELRAVMAVPARGEIGSTEMNAALEADAQKLIAMGVDPLTGEVFASTPAVMPPPVPEVPAVVAPFVPPPPPVAPIAPPTVPPATPGVSTAAPTADPTTMPELMPRVTGAMAEGKIPPTAMLDACKAVGLPDLPSLAHRPDLIQQVWATLKASHPGVWS